MSEEKLFPCTVCKEDKTIDQFHKNGAVKRGCSYRCKECTKEVHRKRVESGWFRSPKYREYRKKNELGTYLKRKTYLKAYEEKNPLKTVARRKVYTALKNGLLEKGKCVTCKADNVQAHHHAGYDKENWLNVTWLCQTHHSETHYKEND